MNKPKTAEQLNLEAGVGHAESKVNPPIVGEFEKPVIDMTPGATSPGFVPTIRDEDTDEEPSLMQLIAREGNVEKLEKLIDLRNRERDREAKKEFARDYVRMKPKLPRVISLHKNTQTNSLYAKLEDINKIIDPILAEHGFATQHKVVAQTEKQVTVRVELWHVSGHIESTELSMPLDDSGIAGKVNKTQPHAIASTIMYLRRVGECALLNISTGQDVDGNLPGATSQLISIEQAADIDTRLRALGDDALPRFLKWAKLESVTELSLRNYPAAIKAIVASEAESALPKSKATP